MSDSRADIEGSTAEPSGDTSSPRRTPRWRRILVSLLVIVGCVLAPLSVLSVWIRNTMLDTDQYVETVGPLIDNPDVQSALATRITNAVVEGSGAAMIFAGSTATKAVWHKEDRNATMSFTSKSGKAITLKPGHIWLEAVPRGGSISS